MTMIMMRSSRIAALLAMLAGGCPAVVWAETGNVAPDRRAVVKKPWIRLTGPGGEAVHINVEQVTSVRPDAEMGGRTRSSIWRAASFSACRKMPTGSCS